MFKGIFTIAWRNLRKDRLFSKLNLWQAGGVLMVTDLCLSYSSRYGCVLHSRYSDLIDYIHDYQLSKYKGSTDQPGKEPAN